jgi:hypothetical protein
MMSKTVKPAFQMLIGGSLIKTATVQAIEETPGNFVNGGLTSNVSKASATLDVVSNTFTDPAVLILGDYKLVSGVHYAVGGSLALTAAAIAAAIDNLAEFEATSALAQVTINSARTGSGGWDIPFEAYYEGTVVNFTLTPNSGEMTDGEPARSSITLGT